MKQKKVTYPSLPLAALVMTVLVLLGCNISTPDFSAWQGTNLIPQNGFESLAWIPDGDADTDLDGNADSRTASGSGDFDNTWTSLTRIDTLTFGSPSRYTAAYSGFATSADLYAGISTAALLSDGSNPPVYRIEVKNLFADGDFENGTGLAAGYSGVDNAGNSAPSYAKANEASSSGGQQLRIALESNDSLDLDFATLVSDFSLTTEANYSMGFKFLISRESVSSFWNPDDPSNRTPFVAAYPRDADDVVVGSGTWIRYPFDTNPGKSASVLSVSPGTHVFRINYKADPPFDTLNPLWLDNFQVVNLNKALGIRLKVPYKLLDPAGTALRPELMEGGTYTLKFEIRRDPGVLTETTRRLNSYSADHLSVSIHRIQDTLTSTNPNPTTCKVFEITPSMDAWTTITADFTSLIQNIDPETQLATDVLLELFISPTDVRNDSRRTPGSLLISAPRLSWSQN